MCYMDVVTLSRAQEAMSSRLTWVALVALSACTPPRQSGSTSPVDVVVGPHGGVQVDHVIIAIDSLERGIALLRDATGVTAVFGGAHPGRGTQNALLSLGGSYLELLAPNPSDANGPMAVQMFARARSLTPTGWALTAPNIESIRTQAIRSGLPGGVVADGARARPDGTTLRWRTLNPWGSNLAMLPFFIEWHATSPHPSRETPGGCKLVMLTLHSTHADSLRGMLARLDVLPRVLNAARDSMSVTLDCPKGRVTF